MIINCNYILRLTVFTETLGRQEREREREREKERKRDDDDDDDDDDRVSNDSI